MIKPEGRKPASPYSWAAERKQERFNRRMDILATIASFLIVCAIAWAVID